MLVKGVLSYHVSNYYLAPRPLTRHWVSMSYSINTEVLLKICMTNHNRSHIKWNVWHQEYICIQRHQYNKITTHARAYKGNESREERMQNLGPITWLVDVTLVLRRFISLSTPFIHELVLAWQQALKLSITGSWCWGLIGKQCGNWLHVIKSTCFIYLLTKDQCFKDDWLASSSHTTFWLNKKLYQ